MDAPWPTVQFVLWSPSIRGFAERAEKRAALWTSDALSFHFDLSWPEVDLSPQLMVLSIPLLISWATQLPHKSVSDTFNKVEINATLPRQN